MHGRDQHHTLFNAVLIQDYFDLGGNVNELTVPLGVESEMLRMELHENAQLELKE
jgi:hypothetical protein